jgi:dynein light intermediate chain 1
MSYNQSSKDQDTHSTSRHNSSIPDANINSASASFISNTQSMFTGLQVKSTGMEGEGDKKVNLWYTLLKNVAKREETKVAHLLVLGDRGVGKRSLIKAMNKPFLKELGIQINVFEEIGSDFSLLESSYLYMKDLAEYEEANQNIGLDDSSLLLINVWVISDEDMGQMIPKILKPEDLEFTMAIIMPEMEHPWDLMGECEKWVEVLKEGIFQITPKLELKQMQLLRERNEMLFKTY